MSFSASQHSDDSPEKERDGKKDTLENIRVLYICDLPESLMDAKIMRQHFSQFATVERVYISHKRRSCTVHFRTHDEAEYARKHGGVLNGVQLNIFWSHSKSPDSKTKKLQREADAGKRASKRTRAKSDEDIGKDVLDRLRSDENRNIHNSPLRHKTQQSTSIFQSCLRKSAKPIPFGTTEPGSESPISVENENVSQIAAVSSQQPELEDKKEVAFQIPSEDAGAPSAADKQRKYTIKLAQKMVKNCKRKELLLYRAKRSASQSEEISRSPEENDDAPPERRDKHSEKERRSRDSTRSPTKKKVAKFELPDEVMDELKALGGLDRMRVLERPAGASQLPWKLHTTETSEATPPSRWLKSEVRKKSPTPMVQPATQSLESTRLKLSEFDVYSTNVAEIENMLRQPARTAEARYLVLEARDMLMKSKESKLSSRKNNQGTCPDMCPEKERYLRKFRRQLDFFETRSDEAGSSYHQYAVKEYARSSADQQMPMPHDLRPVSVLRMTMNYLIRQFVDLADDSRESLGDWYHFLWDRTRSIRKDITQQEICDLDSVAIVEQCARFHIFCSERMREEDLSAYDEKINTENLTKCLQTLKYMYADLTVKGIDCPHEAEFQAYKVLLNLNSGSCMLEVQSLKDSIQHSEPIKFATKVYLVLSDNNYVRFFKLVKSTTYLNACILHRYFHQVRAKAIHTMIAAYGSRKRDTAYPLADIQKLLLFDSIEETADFCRHFHLKVKGQDVILQHIRKVYVPSGPLAVKRAYAAIESKRSSSIKELIVGSVLPDDEFPLRAPHDSFDESGVLKSEAWNAEDQIPSKSVIVSSQPVNVAQKIPVAHILPLKVPAPEVAVEVVSKQKPSQLDDIRQQTSVPQKEKSKPVVDVPKETREGSRKVATFSEVQATPPEVIIPVTVADLVPQPVEHIEETAEVDVEEEEEEEEEEGEEEEEDDDDDDDDDEQTEIRQEEPVLADQTEEEDEILERKLVSFEEAASTNTVPNFVFSIESLNKEKPTVPFQAPDFPDFREESPETEEYGETKYPDTEHTVAVTDRRSDEEEIEDEEFVEEEDEEEDYDDNLDEKEEEMGQLEEVDVNEESLISVAEETIPKRSPVVHYANPDFTAWFSSLSLAEQARQLHVPGGASSCNFKEWRPSRRIHSYRQKKSWPDIGSIFMENVITSELIQRLQNLHILEREMFWKLLLSVPDPDESPRYCDELLRWIDETFVQDKTKLSDIPEQLETLRLARERTRYGIMNSSVQRLVGYLEKSEPLQGIHGVLMFVASDSEDMLHRYQRLLRILELRRPLPLLPIAVVTDCQRLLAEDEVWLQQLVDSECISQFKIFQRSDVSEEQTISVVESALKWLAFNTPSSPDFEVMPLKLLWETCIVDDIWNRICYLASKGIDNVDQNFNELINIHNSALEAISQLCLKDDLFQYSSGAREFLPFIKMSYYPPKVFINRVMPEYWGTDSYKATVKEACASAMLTQKLELPSKDDLSLSSFIEICLAAYPELVTEFNHAIWLLCQNEAFGDDIKRAHIIQALAEIQLALAMKQLEDEELIVAVKKADLSAMRKLYSSKFFLPAADIIDIGMVANKWSEELLELHSAKKPKLESQDIKTTKPSPDHMLRLKGENTEVRAFFKEAKLKLAEMEAKIKENEIALKNDLVLFNMLPGSKRKHASRKGRVS
ncbi:germinal-center associated nuclear protein [Anabrus simplex]|uniref:germinal-center associated nuclear protein n=1 Tax=Anabrus simplex TaxID=316456 RepID=UPI0035A2A5C9